MFNASAVGKLRELVLQRAGTACDAAVDQLALSQSAGKSKRHRSSRCGRAGDIVATMSNWPGDATGNWLAEKVRKLEPVSCCRRTYRGPLEEARRCTPSDSGRFPRKFVSGPAV